MRPRGGVPTWQLRKIPPRGQWTLKLRGPFIQQLRICIAIHAFLAKARAQCTSAHVTASVARFIEGAPLQGRLRESGENAHEGRWKRITPDHRFRTQSATLFESNLTAASIRAQSRVSPPRYPHSAHSHERRSTIRGGGVKLITHLDADLHTSLCSFQPLL